VYWILLLMGLVAALVAAMLVGGLATPRHHVVARTAHLRTSADRVWHAVHDVANYERWRDDMIEVEVVSVTGAALSWREVTSAGSVLFGALEVEPPVRLVAQVLDDDLPWGGTWTWEVMPENGGTRLTITERAHVNNPITRFIGTHFVGFTGRIDRYIRALALHLDEQSPEILPGRG
jgi:uncharacterized protein YndB with AHSA1/START domain